MDSEQGKLFVGGISWELKEETLKDHFQKYGEVVESVIMKDKATGSSRGFGFVQFSDPSAAERALQESHVILGKTVDVKKAVPKGERCQPHQRQQQSKGSNKNSASSSCRCTYYSVNQVRTKKIFVGGLSSNLTEEAFRSYFEKFGRITDVVVMYDSVTRRPRGFGFITFDSEDAVDNVMQKNFHQLNDKLVEVKRAVPKEVSTFTSSYNMRMGSGRGSGPYEPEGGFYPCPKYEFFHGYPPAPFSAYENASSYPYGVYPMGSGYGYGSYTTLIGGVPPPRSPWNSLGMFDARRSPMPYGNAIYPSYINGGVGSLVGASSGVVARDVQTMVEGSNGGTLCIEGAKLDNGTSSLDGSCGNGGGDEQNQRGPGAQHL